MENPNADRIKDVRKDVDNYSALAQLKDSEGGKLLISTYASDIITTLTIMVSGYKKMSQTELIGYCASIAEKIEVLRTLTRSGVNLDGAKAELTTLLTAEPS